MTDAELDELTATLRYENRVLSDGRALTAIQAADAISYMRHTLKSVLQREAETYARHDAKVTALEAQLSERDPIGAAVMRERAAAWMDSNSADLKADASRFRGGTDPHHYRLNSAREARQYADAIRTLPLPTHAELLAHALQLPEIKALVDALNVLRHSVLGESGFAAAVRSDSGFVYPWPSLDDADRISVDALAAIEQEELK